MKACKKEKCSAIAKVFKTKSNPHKILKKQVMII